jgi:hypothetical protein
MKIYDFSSVIGRKFACTIVRSYIRGTKNYAWVYFQGYPSEDAEMTWIIVLSALALYAVIIMFGMSMCIVSSRADDCMEVLGKS